MERFSSKSGRGEHRKKKRIHGANTTLNTDRK